MLDAQFAADAPKDEDGEEGGQGDDDGFNPNTQPTEQNEDGEAD